MTSDSDRIAWVQHAANVVLGAAFKAPNYQALTPKLSAGSQKRQERIAQPVYGTRTRYQAPVQGRNYLPAPDLCKVAIKRTRGMDHVRAIVGAWVY